MSESIPGLELLELTAREGGSIVRNQHFGYAMCCENGMELLDGIH